jgi:RNA polymerase sigma factor (sigma-70 family)
MFKSLLKRRLPPTIAGNEDPSTQADLHQAYTDLVKRIIDGDVTAEAELVSIFKDRIVHIILRIANNTSMVEDFSQDTFVTIIRKIRNGDLNQPASLGSFVASVARNHALEQMRVMRRRATEDLEHAEQVVDPSPSPLEKAQTSEQLDEIREVIGQLIPRYKELLLRFYIYEESKESICAALGMTSGQFDGVVHRARNRFRALYLKRKEHSEKEAEADELS